MGLKDKLRAMGVAQVAPKIAPVHEGCRVLTAHIDKTACVSARAMELLDGQSWHGFDLTRALFIDTETTGLSGGAGTVAFLVGLGWLSADGFEVEQLFMPDYDAEAEMLVLLNARLNDCDAVITFNGKSYDMPLIESRFVMHRMHMPEKAHLDLLHPARRTWKLRLNKCNLGALEERILGIARQGDIPGAEIPTRYFDYLKTRDEGLLNNVFEHNKLDVVSMLLLLERLAAAYDSPLEQLHIEDVFSVGKVMIKRGETGVGHKCFRMAHGTKLSERAFDALSMSLKRDKCLTEAVAVWEGMVLRGETCRAAVELSKYYEHKCKDYARALHYAQLALAAQNADIPALNRRIARIVGKMERG